MGHTRDDTRQHVCHRPASVGSRHARPVPIARRPHVLAAPALSGPTTAAPTPRSRRVATTTVAVAREVALVLVLFGLYKAGRKLTSDHLARAFDNAREVVHIERTLGWFAEDDLQRFFLRFPEVIQLLNRYYLFLHFPATVTFLVWAFARHRSGYRTIRNVIASVTFAGLLIHIAYPLAPPRMLTGFGFVDTGQVFGPGAYGHGGVFDSTANQIAAMPSLHFAWSAIVAWGTAVLAGPVLRAIAITHSFLTLMAIVITANHYFLDAAVGFLLVVVAVMVFGRSMRFDRVAPPVRPTLAPVT